MALFFEPITIGLHTETKTLHKNIEQRVARMMTQGLLQEVKTLAATEDPTLLRKTIGYREFFPYLAGACSLDAAVQNIERNTKKYAKRQHTWFKRDPTITWFHPEDLAGMKNHLQRVLR